MNSKNALNLLDPDNLLKVLHTKADKSRIDDNFSTLVLKVSDLQESEINEKKERKIASTKALLSLFLFFQKNKIDFGHLSPNYKFDNAEVFNKYIKNSVLEDSLIPFSVKGARELFNEVNDIINTLSKTIGKDIGYKINYENLVHTFNYYNNDGVFEESSDDDKKKSFSKKASMDMFNFLYEHSLNVEAISDEYFGNIEDRTFSQITDSISKKKLDKIATTFALKSAFDSLTKTLLSIEASLNEDVSIINSFLDTNFKGEKNFMDSYIEKGTPFVAFPHSSLTSGVYHLSISMKDFPNNIDIYQVFKIMIPDTIDSSRAKIIYDDSVSYYMNNDDFRSSFELRYDDDSDKGLVIVLLGEYTKTIGVPLNVKLRKTI